MAPRPSSDIAQALLAKALEALTDDPPGNPPAIARITHNRPALDKCREDQLTVWVESRPVRQSRGARGNQRAQSQVMVTWHLDIYRCAAGIGEQGGPPTVEAEEATALGLLDDIDAIQRKIQRESDQVFGPSPMVEYGIAVPVGPLGYVAGWSWPLTAGRT
jgi:hypothetical protein